MREPTGAVTAAHVARSKTRRSTLNTHPSAAKLVRRTALLGLLYARDNHTPANKICQEDLSTWTSPGEVDTGLCAMIDGSELAVARCCPTRWVAGRRGLQAPNAVQPAERGVPAGSRLQPPGLRVGRCPSSPASGKVDSTEVVRGSTTQDVLPRLGQLVRTLELRAFWTDAIRL